MSSLQVTGKLLVKYDTQQVNDKFKKREFVLELAEEINGNVYTNYAKFQAVQNKCEILDRFNKGDMVDVSFNIKGNRWERDGKVNYITNLDAWQIKAAQGVAPIPTQTSTVHEGVNAPNTSGYYNPSPNNVDDLPF